LLLGLGLLLLPAAAAENAHCSCNPTLTLLCVCLWVWFLVCLCCGPQLLLLENVRFYKEEEKNDAEFAKKLAANADLYVNDAFGTAHRAHASTEGVTKFLKPSVSGFLLQKVGVRVLCAAGGTVGAWVVGFVGMGIGWEGESARCGGLVGLAL
jgi:hypothetical protein